MPRMPLHLASGTGLYQSFTKKSIRLLKMGCTNRPFYHIVVIEAKSRSKIKPPIEQLGSFDPCYNSHNEKLVALNLERILFWLGQGVEVSRPLRRIFGIAGLFPIHPTTFMDAWRNREQETKKAEEKVMKIVEDKA